MTLPVCNPCQPGHPSVIQLAERIMIAADQAFKHATFPITEGQYTRIRVAIAQKLTNIPPFTEAGGSYAQNCVHVLAAHAAAHQSPPDWNLCADELEHGH